MTNRLKSYVRRQILVAARDYANGNRRTPESTKSALMDATRGTDTGWWSDLIYTAPMLEMAHRYRRDIATALLEYQDATGEAYSHRDGTAAGIACALLSGPYSFAQYREEEEGGPAGQALLGLRFAVEWYAGEIATELCPDW